MNRENETHEINLKYAIIYVLRHWRTMICLGLVLAVLFGAYKGISGLGNWDNAQKEFEKANKIYKNDLATYETKIEQYDSQIKDYEKDIKAQAKYFEESILMNLDYRNTAYASASVFFKLDEASMDKYGAVAYDPADSLMTLFYYKIYYNTNWDAIAEKYNTNSKYISELVNYENQKDSNILKITVSHSEIKAADEILDELIKIITDEANSFDGGDLNYTVSISKNETNFVKSSRLLDLQREAKEFVTKTADTVASIKNSKETLVKPVLAVEEPSYTSLIKSVLVFAVIGAILGVIAVASIYALLYIFGDKVHSEEEISEFESFRILGRVPVLTKKRFGKRIDSVIEALTDVNSHMTDSQKEKLLIYNIKDVVNNAKAVLLIGGAPEESLDKVKALILSSLPDVSVTLEKDIVKNVDAYEKISENDIIIAVEKIEYSKYADIYNTADLIESKNKELTGYILV